MTARKKPKNGGGEFGTKVALQDHGPRDGRSGPQTVHDYFYNRYSRKQMLEPLRALPGADVTKWANRGSRRARST